MSADFFHPANAISNTPSPRRAGPRHRKRSSSLCALNDLSLPSPPLSPSVSIVVSKDASFDGEIPIIFDFLTTGSMPSEERISKMASLKPTLPPLAKFSPMSAFFPMSDSSGSLNTISTQAFGTKRPESCCSHDRFSMFSDYSTVDSPLNLHFDLPSPTNLVNSEDRDGTQTVIAPSLSTPAVQVLDYDIGQQALGDVSDFTISAYFDSPSSACMTAVSDKIKGPAESLEVIHESSMPDKTPSTSSPNSESQFLTIRARGPSLAINIEDDKTPTQSMFLKYQLQEPVPLPSVKGENSEATSILADGSTLSTMEYASATGSSLTVPSLDFDDDETPTQMTFLKRQTDAETASGPMQTSQLLSDPVANQFVNSIPLHTEKSSTYQFSGLPSPLPLATLPVPCLSHAQWLRDTIVELWIDQEGFRAIRPKFFLASVSNGLPYTQSLPHQPQFPSPLNAAIPDVLAEEHDPLYTTVAEFLPVTRTAHYFHHAALDRAPTLHRITTGGDETRDYITRAATMGIRENGVFFVHGTEDHRLDSHNHPHAVERSAPNAAGSTTSSTNSHPIGRIVRLNWRFEYFVSSRRPDGRSAHRGEKVFTPLSFSCTPALLDRTRASKVKVFHIMKKTLLPNLVAQKLEPPNIPNPDVLPHLPLSVSFLSSGASFSSLATTCFPPSESIDSHTRTLESPPRAKSNSNSTSQTKSPPRPPLRHSKQHRRGSHSDSAPAEYSLQRLRARADNLAAHERSRSASSAFPSSLEALPPLPAPFNPKLDMQSRPAPVGPNVGLIIPKEELMKMFDEQRTAEQSEMKRRPHSLRVEVHDNVQQTTLPAAPRHR